MQFPQQQKEKYGNALKRKSNAIVEANTQIAAQFVEQTNSNHF